MVIESPVELAGNLGRLGAIRGTSALEENDRHNMSVLGLGIGGEPAEARAVLGAGAGLAALVSLYPNRRVATTGGVSPRNVLNAGL